MGKRRRTQLEIEQEMMNQGRLAPANPFAPHPGNMVMADAGTAAPDNFVIDPKRAAAADREDRRLAFNRRAAEANSVRGLVPGDAGFRAPAPSEAERRNQQIQHRRNVANTLRQRAIDATSTEGSARRERLTAAFENDLNLQARAGRQQRMPLSRSPISLADAGGSVANMADGQLYSNDSGQFFRNDARADVQTPMVWNPSGGPDGGGAFEVDVESPDLSVADLGQLVISPLPKTATPQQQQTHARLVEAYNNVIADESLTAAQRREALKGIIDRRETMQFAPERPSEREHPNVAESGVPGFDEVGTEPFVWDDGSLMQYTDDGRLDILRDAPPSESEKQQAKADEAAEAERALVDDSFDEAMKFHTTQASKDGRTGIDMEAVADLAQKIYEAKRKMLGAPEAGEQPAAAKQDPMSDESLANEFGV